MEIRRPFLPFSLHLLPCTHTNAKPFLSFSLPHSLMFLLLKICTILVEFFRALHGALRALRAPRNVTVAFAKRFATGLKASVTSNWRSPALGMHLWHNELRPSASDYDNDKRARRREKGRARPGRRRVRRARRSRGGRETQGEEGGSVVALARRISCGTLTL